MNVFLTGATGYLGSAIAAQLTASGHRVTGLARNEAAAEKLSALGLQPIRGTLLDGPALSEAARAADAVIHAASTNDPGAPAADRFAIDTILGALRASNKPLIYTSGIWVLGNNRGRQDDEDAELDPAPIVMWRPPVERLVLASAADGVRAVVVRPPVVYGNGGGIVAMLADEARQHGVVRFVGDGEQLWSLVHRDDLADLYHRLLTAAGAGSLWHAAAGEPVRVRDIALAISEAHGIPGMIKSWPVEEAGQTLGAFGDALAMGQGMSGKRAERLLGWKPGRPGILEDIRAGGYGGDVTGN